MNDRTPRGIRRPHQLSDEISYLLAEIEKEPIPERLLDLARQLQARLTERRANGDGRGR